MYTNIALNEYVFQGTFHLCSRNNIEDAIAKGEYCKRKSEGVSLPKDSQSLDQILENASLIADSDELSVAFSNSTNGEVMCQRIPGDLTTRRSHHGGLTTAFSPPGGLTIRRFHHSAVSPLGWFTTRRTHHFSRKKLPLQFNIWCKACKRHKQIKGSETKIFKEIEDKLPLFSMIRQVYVWGSGIFSKQIIITCKQQHWFLGKPA